MKHSISDDEQSEKGDFFDPFWMLFNDEEEEGPEIEDVQRKKRNSKKYKENEPGGMFDYFMSDVEDDSVPEVREPRDSSKKSQKQKRPKKQHYWRRNQVNNKKRREPAPRRSFGIKTNPKRSHMPSSNDSLEYSMQSERRDTPDRSERNLESSNERSSEIFPANLVDAFVSGWDPWGDAESSSGSSEGSYTEESNMDDDSAVSGSIGSRPGARGPREVQQILVQFNPAPAPKRNVEATTMEPNSPPKGLKKSNLTESIHEGSTIHQPRPGPASFFGNDQSTINSIGKIEGLKVAQPQAPYGVLLEEKEPSKCMDFSKICGLGTKKDKEKQQRFPVPCKSKSSRELEDPNNLTTAFPKLRMVADEKDCVGSTAVVANSTFFKVNIPAHLQLSSEAFLATKGPQSLYEYEYDGGEHIDVAYNHFGPNPLSLLVIRHHLTPPRPRNYGVIVQVEASTISMSDCSMRRGEWMGKDTPPLPITPGVDMVGKIFRIESEVSAKLDLSIGDRVISLTRCGGNSRFLSIDPWQLVKISEGVDPAEAACLAETYLSAFQVLHFGQGAGLRYRNNALKGKSILILGTIATTLGHALIELAAVAGVAKIIATSAPKHFPHLRSLGIIPVSTDPALWYDQLNEEIDLVIVSNSNEEVVAEHFKVLNDRGHLIVVGQQMGSGMPIGDWESEVKTRSLVCKRQKSKFSMIDRTHDYNPFRLWEQDLDKCKKDLSHLVKLLEKGEIKPNVLDRIPLNKVAKAQDMVESGRHPGGFLVCEPWLRNKKRAVRL